MSSVVKCANCNVVINEVLAFVHNKISVMDDESISRICTSAFSENEILTAKKLLFESLPTTKRKITRRKAGKKNGRDIDDIICLIRDTDSEDIPVFVARDLEKLPPVLFDHVDVTRLLKDIVKLRQDLDMIKEDYATIKQMDQLKSEVQQLSSGWCNVNSKRGAYAARRLSSYECDSGPMGLPMECNDGISKCYQQQSTLESTLKSSIHNRFEHQVLEGISITTPQIMNCNETVEQRDAAKMTHTASQLIEPLTCLAAQSAAAPLSVHCATDETLASAPPVATDRRGPLPSDPLLPAATCTESLSPSSGSPIVHTVDNNVSSLITSKRKSLAEIVREGKWKTQAPSDQWVRVQKKRSRNRFVGKRGSAVPEPGSNFTAAETKIPIYIYNVAKGVSN
ncbi:hypothetical protein HW555_007140 [Spodoptera exigua]|uniref:Mutant cadherin n=1 Tax=Spodoptera exigua TaxID=7107 RepID=A0A835L4N9_SPOEX|nr:hypothetical protein HW555_007140 [Spodoptera exigua]